MNILIWIYTTALAWTLTQSNCLRDKLDTYPYYTGKDKEIVMVVKWAEGEDEDEIFKCQFYRHNDFVSRESSLPDGSPIQTLSPEELQNLPPECVEAFLQKTRPGIEKTVGREEDSWSGTSDDILNEWTGGAKNRWQVSGGGGTKRLQKFRRRVMYPGTKWCGDGRKGKDKDDLGRFKDTDRCCRDHDLCGEGIDEGETKFNLTNESKIFSAISCECDDKLHDCFKQVNSIHSNFLGNLYFNVLRKKCFKLDYPLTDKCKRYFFWKCVEYERNTTAPKVYQWRKARWYR